MDRRGSSVVAGAAVEGVVVDEAAVVAGRCGADVGAGVAVAGEPGSVDVSRVSPSLPQAATTKTDAVRSAPLREHVLIEHL
jgi:hypothetical protein